MKKIYMAVALVGALVFQGCLNSTTSSNKENDLIKKHETDNNADHMEVLTWDELSDEQKIQVQEARDQWLRNNPPDKFWDLAVEKETIKPLKKTIAGGAGLFPPVFAGAKTELPGWEAYRLYDNSLATAYSSYVHDHASHPSVTPQGHYQQGVDYDEFIYFFMNGFQSIDEIIVAPRFAGNGTWMCMSSDLAVYVEPNGGGQWEYLGSVNPWVGGTQGNLEVVYYVSGSTIYNFGIKFPTRTTRGILLKDRNMTSAGQGNWYFQASEVLGKKN